MNLFAMAAWAAGILLPLLLVATGIYVNVFMTSTCLSLGDRFAAATTPGAANVDY
jgi:hypothetical protein